MRQAFHRPIHGHRHEHRDPWMKFLPRYEKNPAVNRQMGSIYKYRMQRAQLYLNYVFLTRRGLNYSSFPKQLLQNTVSCHS